MIQNGCAPPGSNTHLSAAPPAKAEAWESHTIRCAVSWGRSGAVIEVRGELDASNAGEFADFVARCAARCQWLVVDLDDLEFIGTAGFTALQSINARCVNTRVYWAVVPGAAVSRLLPVCDPGNALPVNDSVPAALAAVRDGRELLRLFTDRHG